MEGEGEEEDNLQKYTNAVSVWAQGSNPALPWSSCAPLDKWLDLSQPRHLHL